VRFKASRCESWRTKKGALEKKGWCLLGKILGDGKHISGKSFPMHLVSRLDLACCCCLWLFTFDYWLLLILAPRI